MFSKPQIKQEEPFNPSYPSFYNPAYTSNLTFKLSTSLPQVNSNYQIETHYKACNFQNSFELLKKMILDLAAEKEENCEYDIIVKKRKVIIPPSNPFQEDKDSSLSNMDHSKKNEESFDGKESSKHRHKNCPKLFGRAFFNLVLNNKGFQEMYLKPKDFNLKSSLGIKYPNKPLELKVSDFLSWIRREKFNEKYTNLKVFRDIWSWPEDSDNNYVEKHYKYYLTKLMKIFFEEYAYNYIIKSNIQHLNGIDYINFIPKFLSGIEDPHSFSSLK